MHFKNTCRPVIHLQVNLRCVSGFYLQNLLKAAGATQKQLGLVRLHEQTKKNLEQEIQVTIFLSVQYGTSQFSHYPSKVLSWHLKRMSFSTAAKATHRTHHSVQSARKRMGWVRLFINNLVSATSRQCHVSVMFPLSQTSPCVLLAAIFQLWWSSHCCPVTVVCLKANSTCLIAELQRWSSEAAQDHLPAGEGARSLHQRGQWTHPEGAAAHGGRQGPRDADLRLQEEDRRGRNQTQAAAGTNATAGVVFVFVMSSLLSLLL